MAGYCSYDSLTYAGKSHAGVTVIAHRGASAHFPENTLAAFQGAIDMGADMVELDVQLSADGEVVVFHDDTLSRCTQGRGRLADYRLAQLKKLDAGSWFAKAFSGETIPTLDEVLHICRGRIAVNIEIKTEAVTDSPACGIEEKCLARVSAAGMRDHVAYSSFDPRAIGHLKAHDPGACVAILYEKKLYPKALPSQIVSALGAQAFNCAYRELSAKRLADLKAQAIPFHVYTVNDEKSMRQVIALGASGIFTNWPERLRKVREALL